VKTSVALCAIHNVEVPQPDSKTTECGVTILLEVFYGVGRDERFVGFELLKTEFLAHRYSNLSRSAPMNND